MKKSYIWIIVVIVLFAGAIIWSRYAVKNDKDIVSKEGLHWHSKMSITINGEKIAIPPNIGITPYVHSPVHTHDEELGTIHMEFTGLVKKDNLHLEKFFEAWGKRFDIQCIFDNCSRNGTISMKVNSVPNSEYGEYVMHDGDLIEIDFTTK